MRRRLLFESDNNTYLTFIPINSCTFKFSRSIYYSIDNGTTWTHLASDTNTPVVNSGSKILWKKNGVPSSLGIGIFSSTDKFIASGNPLSLIYADQFLDKTSVGYDHVLFRLFYENPYIINAENIILPATGLDEFCYGEMFRECANLIRGPKILPATIAVLGCYSHIFYHCHSLIVAPKIELTSIAGACCQQMFHSCSQLTKAPDLYCPTLDSMCYYYMFYGCTSLNYVKALFTTTPGGSPTTNWLYNVAANGTFVKSSSATWNVTGPDGIPSGWTIQTL